MLLRRLGALGSEAAAAREARRTAGVEDGAGLQIEFESFPGVELAVESLARERQGIELLNVRRDGDRTAATVFVPEGKLDRFEKLVRDYLEEKRDRADRRRDNRRLIDTIRNIRAASLRALWTDSPEEFPADGAAPVWWEVWLSTRRDRRGAAAAFRRRARARDMEVVAGELKFPERAVLLVRASPDRMRDSVAALDAIAELRRPKETADFFDSLRPDEQSEWLDDLLERARYPDDAEEVPHVCLLDTGVNIGHPLLSPGLAAADLHTVEPAWGAGDDDGHGTAMAGTGSRRRSDGTPRG